MLAATPNTARAVVLNALVAGRVLIARGWTTGTRVRDAQGEPVDPKDPAAVAWCVEGAIKAVVAHPATFWAALVVLGDANNRVRPSWLNDNGDKASALAMFDRAIEREMGK